MNIPTGDPPTGTVTFMFTDIEGSTRLLQDLGLDRARKVLEEHHRILRSAIAGAGGLEIQTEGDAFFAVFTTASGAVAAAAQAQRELAAGSWPTPVRVRMGLHTGEGTRGGDNYVGLDVHVAARIAAAGHGGQVLISETTRTLAQSEGSERWVARSLGEHRLKDLGRPLKLFQLVIDGLPSDFPPIRSLGNKPNNLPSQPTSFIGRKAELEELAALLGRARCVSLTGPGGTGKTRLSLQLARSASDGFEDGVFFVPLAPVTDPGMVAGSIAQSLSLPETRGETRSPEERVSEHLRGRKMLLLLDNFEQLLSAAGLVSNLLTAADGLKVVVTTRIPLRIQAEHEYPVQPLDLPDPRQASSVEKLSQYESVALFIERALSVKPDFRVTNDNAPAIAEICARLDGLPLAIELAAARVRVLSPESLLARLGERLKLLVGGATDLPERQKTLRGAIDWSHDLLDEHERQLFRRFSVFVRGCRLEEAEKVCGLDDGGEVFETIASLIDKSLVKTDETHPAEIRFFMLETIREYAREKLAESGEEEVVRAAHARVYAALAEEAAPNVFGPRRRWWLDRLQSDTDNLRSAHDWALETKDAGLALEMVVNLWRFWHMRGFLQEGRRRAEDSLALPGADQPSALRARALQAAGGIAHWQAEVENQAAFYDQAIALWRQLGDDLGLAEALYDRVFAYSYGPAGMAAGIQPGYEALAVAEKTGNALAVAKAKWALSLTLAFGAGDFEAAERALDQGLETFIKEQDFFMQLWVLFSKGVHRTAQNRPEEAEPYLREALRLSAESMDLSGILFQLDQLAVAAQMRGDVQRSIKLAAAASALKTSSGADLVDRVRQNAGVQTPGRNSLSEQSLKQAWAEAERWNLEEAIAYALQGG